MIFDTETVTQMFNGKTVASIDTTASNAWVFKFTDGSYITLWSEIGGSLGLPYMYVEQVDHPKWEFKSTKTCVHTEHCCVMEGCKYGDADCPVWLGYKPQTYNSESYNKDTALYLAIPEFEKRRNKVY